MGGGSNNLENVTFTNVTDSELAVRLNLWAGWRMFTCCRVFGSYGRLWGDSQSLLLHSYIEPCDADLQWNPGQMIKLGSEDFLKSTCYVHLPQNIII